MWCATSRLDWLDGPVDHEQTRASVLSTAGLEAAACDQASLTRRASCSCVLLVTLSFEYTLLRW